MGRKGCPLADSSLPAGPAIPHPDPNTLSFEGAGQNGKRAAQVIGEGLRLLKHKRCWNLPTEAEKALPQPLPFSRLWWLREPGSLSRDSFVFSAEGRACRDREALGMHTRSISL